MSNEKPQEETRGPKCPGVNLGTALELLRQVRDGVGYGKANRETVARAMGYKSLNGRSNRAIAALLHFGLMDRSGASALQISELGKRILVPREEREIADAIATAATRPALYQKLFGRFAGHGLPTLLPNILVREFGALPSSSEEMAKIFRESADFAGLLRNGVLEAELTSEAPERLGQIQPDSEPVPRVEASERETAADEKRTSYGDGLGRAHEGMQRYSIPLDSTGRLALIDIPVPVSETDLRRIRRWSEFMLSLMEDETPSISGN